MHIVCRERKRGILIDVCNIVIPIIRFGVRFYYYCIGAHIISAKNRQLANSYHFEYAATEIHLFLASIRFKDLVD